MTTEFRGSACFRACLLPDAWRARLSRSLNWVCSAVSYSLRTSTDTSRAVAYGQF